MKKETSQNLGLFGGNFEGLWADLTDKHPSPSPQIGLMLAKVNLLFEIFNSFKLNEFIKLIEN